MFPALIILSLGIGAIILFFVSAKFWFPEWRKNKSGTAHGLFLTNAFLFWIVIFKMTQVITRLIDDEGCGYPYSLISAFFMLFVGIFQFALTRGYFNFKE